MRPHTKDLYRALCLQHLIQQPVLDIDSSRKGAREIANQLFDQCLGITDVETVGITGVRREDIEKAQTDGRVIKLIGSVRWEKNRLCVKVAPEALEADHPLAGVHLSEKGISFDTDSMGRITVTGGHSSPTGAAAALLKDLIHARCFQTQCFGVGTAANGHQHPIHRQGGRLAFPFDADIDPLLRGVERIELAALGGLEGTEGASEQGDDGVEGVGSERGEPVVDDGEQLGVVEQDDDTGEQGREQRSVRPGPAQQRQGNPDQQGAALEGLDGWLQRCAVRGHELAGGGLHREVLGARLVESICTPPEAVIT